jgi:hypothetical protein
VALCRYAPAYFHSLSLISCIADLCIEGTILDVAVSSNGKSIYIGGDFVICNSNISNFVISTSCALVLVFYFEFNKEISSEYNIIGGGMNGTARTLFVKRDGGVLVGGNFGYGT